MAKKLYKLTPSYNWGNKNHCGTYSCCIVVSDSPESAVKVHPEDDEKWSEKNQIWCYKKDETEGKYRLEYDMCDDDGNSTYDSRWPNPNQVVAKEIGICTCEQLSVGDVVLSDYID